MMDGLIGKGERGGVDSYRTLRGCSLFVDPIHLSLCVASPHHVAALYAHALSQAPVSESKYSLSHRYERELAVYVQFKQNEPSIEEINHRKA